jgi:two-component system NtrC family response regulator
LILIVDDDATVIASLELLLRRAGFATAAASSPDAALAMVSSGGVDLVFQDMNFSRATSGTEGLELLTRIRGVQPDLPVILISAWGSIELAVAGMRRGASDFITKPWSNERVVEAAQTALSLARLGAPALDLSREKLESRGPISGIVGSDPVLLRALDVVLKVAPTEASVLVTGEGGTGKELIAELLHEAGRRAAGPFVKVNLGGLSTTLFESEMFGHVRGAFTDARADRKGRFEAAEGGTIFLDEIGDLDSSCQVKLLRVLQDRSFEALGSSETRRVDVRVVSATNRDLRSAVSTGAFREDLLYRLNLISIHLPALRERRGDIRVLAEHFVNALRRATGRGRLALTDSALVWLESQSWPGNVRQLRATIERAALLSERDQLDVADLAAGEAAVVWGRERESLPPVGAMTLDELERAMIDKAMRHHAGNITHVAEALGVTRAALYRRLKKFGLAT